jgi:hypothetical protein
MSAPPLFWWNINQPQHKRTNVCPPYLIELADKDIVILTTRDEDFDRITWGRCEEFISMSLDACPVGQEATPIFKI